MPSDLLQTGTAWLAEKLKAKASRKVTYRRGTQSVTLQATVGMSVLRLSDAKASGRVERTDRDYTFTATDLVLGGSVVEPQRGDQVVDSLDGRVFEVRTPQGEAPWRYSDSRRNMIRVHTKDVGAA